MPKFPLICGIIEYTGFNVGPVGHVCFHAHFLPGQRLAVRRNKLVSLDFHRWEKSRITDVHVVLGYKVTFFDFSIEFLSETKMMNGLKFKIWNKRNRNNNVAVLHTTSPRAFQRSRGDVNCKDVKPCGLGSILSHLMASSSNT